MASEQRGVRVCPCAPATLERVGDPAVQSDSAGGAQFVEQGLLHQCVCEAVATGAFALLDHLRVERLFELLKQGVLVVLLQQIQGVVGELTTDDRRDLEQRIRFLGEAVEAAPEGFADAIGKREVRDGAGV